MLLALVFCEGNLVFAIPMAWFEEELVLYLVYTLSYFYRIAFLSCLSNLHIVSLSILACILLTMLIIMLG
jgi:hypothetical protein